MRVTFRTMAKRDVEALTALGVRGLPTPERFAMIRRSFGVGRVIEIDGCLMVAFDRDGHVVYQDGSGAIPDLIRAEQEGLVGHLDARLRGPGPDQAQGQASPVHPRHSERSRMTTDAIPASITLYEAEADLLDPELDLDYIDVLAGDLAFLLRSGPAECVYQPGDGTRYPLVIVPLASLRHGRPRVVDGVVWDRHAVSGMKTGGDAAALGADYYDPHGYLISWVEHACYPLRLGGGRGLLAADYVKDHWTDSGASAVSLAILFRAISHHLDHRATAGDTFPSLEAFFAADERRRTSPELDFGVMWIDGADPWPRYRVSALRDTGEVYALRMVGGSLGFDVGERVELLAAGLTVGGYEDAERLLAGWAETSPSTLAWCRDRLRVEP